MHIDSYNVTNNIITLILSKYLIFLWWIFHVIDNANSIHVQTQCGYVDNENEETKHSGFIHVYLIKIRYCVMRWCNHHIGALRIVRKQLCWTMKWVNFSLIFSSFNSMKTRLRKHVCLWQGQNVKTTRWLLDRTSLSYESLLDL